MNDLPIIIINFNVETIYSTCDNHSIDWKSFLLIHSLVSVEWFNKFLRFWNLGTWGLLVPVNLFYQIGFNPNGSLIINNFVHFRYNVSALFIFIFITADNLFFSFFSCFCNFIKSLLVNLSLILYLTGYNPDLFFNIMICYII